MDPPRPADADGFRATWGDAQARWTVTIGKARALPEEQLSQAG